MINRLLFLLLLVSITCGAAQPLAENEPLPVLLQGDYRSDEVHQVLGSKLIYQADMSSLTSIKNEWVVEGPAQLSLEQKSLKQQSLNFSSVLTDDFIQAYQQKKFDFIPGQLTRYHQVLGELAQRKLPEQDYQAMLDNKGNFKGGHIVLWNKQVLPDSYIVEFDLQHQSPMGLFILFFSATDFDGESIFSEHLAARNGVFKQYTSGDITSYHVSSFTPHRGSANLRKNNKGGQLLKSEADLAALAPDKTYKYRLIKWQNRFQLYLNDQLQMDYQDQQGALKGGQVGLRLMASAKAKVSDFSLFKLNDNPFVSKTSKKQVTVRNTNELTAALKKAKAGTTVWLENGIYQDVNLTLAQSGTLTERIYVKAINPGEVTFSGKAAIKITGSHITISGIRFADGSRFDNSDYVANKGNKISKKSPFLFDLRGSYIRLTQCSIDNFDQHHSEWLNIVGSKIRVDHCSFINKQTHGGVLSTAKPPQSGAFHRFDHNYFSRPDIGSDNAEVIRLATGWAHNINAFMTVEYNVFEQCNGEGEVISDKSSSNTIRLNRFSNNQGGLSLRQGSKTHVYGNWFYRDQANQGRGKKRKRDFGVMIRGTDHIIENNHFQGYGPNLVKLVNGQPVGYKKPGRSDKLPRHHIAAENVILRHNDFIVSDILAEIDKRKFTKDRSVLAHDIDFVANLIVAPNQWQPLTVKEYPAVRWQGNAVVGAKQSALKQQSNSYYSSVEALPKAYYQRYGSVPLVDYFKSHQAGASWLSKPIKAK